MYDVIILVNFLIDSSNSRAFILVEEHGTYINGAYIICLNNEYYLFPFVFFCLCLLGQSLNFKHRIKKLFW